MPTLTGTTTMRTTSMGATSIGTSTRGGLCCAKWCTSSYPATCATSTRSMRGGTRAVCPGMWGVYSAATTRTTTASVLAGAGSTHHPSSRITTGGATIAGAMTPATSTTCSTGCVWGGGGVRQVEFRTARPSTWCANTCGGDDTGCRRTTWCVWCVGGWCCVAGGTGGKAWWHCWCCCSSDLGGCGTSCDRFKPIRVNTAELADYLTRGACMG